MELRALGAAVIRQAMLDAQQSGQEWHRQAARYFLLENSADFGFWCGVAQVKEREVRALAERALASRTNDEQAA